MYVVPSARGSGVARALLAALETEARHLGARRRLLLETGARLIAALVLYHGAACRRSPPWRIRRLAAQPLHGQGVVAHGRGRSGHLRAARSPIAPQRRAAHSASAGCFSRRAACSAGPARGLRRLARFRAGVNAHHGWAGSPFACATTAANTSRMHGSWRTPSSAHSDRYTIPVPSGRIFQSQDTQLHQISGDARPHVRNLPQACHDGPLLCLARQPFALLAVHHSRPPLARN